MENKNNSLVKRDVKDYDKVKESYGKNGFNIVELDLFVIEAEQGLADEISDQLKFPYRSTNWDSVDDWITDLEWLDKKNTAILIKNFSFLKAKGFDQLLEVLNDAKEFWSKHNVVFDIVIF